MQPAVHDITIYRGDSYELFVRLREKVWDAETSTFIPGSYISLASMTGKAQLRATADDASVAVEFTVTTGNQTTTPGSAYMRLTAAQTGGLTLTEGVYDLQFTDASTNVQTYLKGAVEIVKDVTRV
jgi:hypothetical protein